MFQAPAFSKILVTLFVLMTGIPSQAEVQYRIGGRLTALGNDDRRNSELVCTMSLFFSMDRDAAQGAKLTGLKSGPVAELDGRGLLSCKNDQGFTTETPVLADLEAELPALTRLADAEATADISTSEVSFSANTEPFVVPREVNQIYDAYTVRDFSWEKPATSGAVSLTFRGVRNDLVIGMKVNSRKSNLTGLKVRNLRLSFDDDAPDFDDKI